jgi:hypothetical protein
MTNFLQMMVSLFSIVSSLSLKFVDQEDIENFSTLIWITSCIYLVVFCCSCACVINLNDPSFAQSFCQLGRFNKLCRCLLAAGSSNLEEWFPRKEPQGVTGPQRRMRPMHPISSVRETGSKKRRITSGCQVWVVGDHVDAFIQDGWWEGVVREVKDGEKKVTVYFPGLPNCMPFVNGS